jgi:hypothetical protein
MKKLLSSFLLILALCVAAPSANAQFRWSGTAGVSFNNLSFKQDLVDVSQTVGYAAGINGELMFPGIGFGLSFGMLYNQQGAEVNLGQRQVWASEGYGKEQVYLHNISIPVHLRFKYTRLNGIEDKIAPMVFGGPEFNIQVAHGNCNAFDYSGGDLGVTAGVGAEIFKRWQLTGSYTWGMTYVLKTSLLDNFSARSRQWNIRLAYFF